MKKPTRPYFLLRSQTLTRDIINVNFIRLSQLTSWVCIGRLKSLNSKIIKAYFLSIIAYFYLSML